MRESTIRTRQLVFIAVLVAQGMILSYIERMIPVPFIVPGAKLGLANIVTLTAVYTLTFKQAGAVVLLRILLTASTFGSLSSFLYSFSGGVLSFLVMYVVAKIFRNDISMMSVSIIGAVTHNLGQLLVAAFVIRSLLVLSYLPLLLIVAVPTGVFVGLVAKFLVGHLEKVQIKN
ncbi:Gx transporter family protein [Fusibacter sp. JL298sf-3]